MVKFESKQSSTGHFLVLKDDIDGEKKTVIPIFPPMTGSFVDTQKIEHYPPNLENWVSRSSPEAILNSSHHDDNAVAKSLNTLYDRICRREATWSSKPQFGVTFSHIPLYWEWAEDIIRRCKTTLISIDLLDAVYASMFLYKCNSPLMQRFCESWSPKTNTVLTGDGEASISLWDLRTLGGLPIFGSFYDEVVPSTTELEGSKDGKHFLSPSCRYLFAALQSILSTSGRSHVTFEEWCRFWFRAPKRYSTNIRPKAIENFSQLEPLETWSKKHEALTFLNVPEEHRQSTYLAAFLSCWLCAFVLPLKNLGCVQPGVFKPASRLASGKRISLAIPVLASIYRGLNELSCSSTPGIQCDCFPAHYVYAWTAQYFRSHCMSIHSFAGARMIAFHSASNGTSNLKTLTKAAAKEFIRSGKDINWVGNCMHTASDRSLVDAGLSRHDTDFLLSIRSCYLTLRYDDEYVFEPYSPHRFSRQFGFCQNLPGELKPHSKETSLKHLWSLFQTSIRIGTKSSFLIPSDGMNNDIRSRATVPFKLWWSLSYAPTGSSMSPPPTHSSRKRKADKDNGINADSKDKGKLRKSSSQSPKAPSPQHEKEGQGKTSSQSPEERTIFHDIFGEGKTTLEGHKDDQDEDCFDYAKELEACGNTFASDKELTHTSAPVDPDVLVAARDPVILHAAATIIARDFEAPHENLTTSTETSSLNVRAMISEADRGAARFLVNQTKAKLLQTPLHNVHDLDSELKELFDYISSKNIVITSLQEHVRNYVEHARTLHASNPSDKESSLSSLEEQFSSLESRLGDVVLLKKKDEAQIKAQHAEMSKTQQRGDELRNQLKLLEQELKLLEKKESEISSALGASKDSLNKHDALVAELSMSHTSLEKEIAAAREATTKQKKAKEDFQNARTALESLQWEP